MCSSLCIVAPCLPRIERQWESERATVRKLSIPISFSILFSAACGRLGSLVQVQAFRTLVMRQPTFPVFFPAFFSTIAILSRPGNRRRPLRHPRADPCQLPQLFSAFSTVFAMVSRFLSRFWKVNNSKRKYEKCKKHKK